MTRQDPYAPPAAAVSELVRPEAPIRWARILAWGALVFAVAAAVYIISGFLSSSHKIYGIEVDDMVVSTASFILYFVFLRTTFRRQFLQLSAVFLAAFLFDLAFTVVVELLRMTKTGEPFGNLVSLPSLVWSIVVCLLAYAAWYLNARRTG